MDTRLKAGMAMLAAAALTTGIVSCGGGGGGSSSGTLSLAVTDAPVDDLKQVVVVFDAIELKPAAGDSIRIELTGDLAVPPIDLLALTGNHSTYILDGVTVPAGDYNWIRLEVTDAAYVVELDDSDHPLEIPSANNGNNPLKLVSGFTVAAGGLSDFTIDFDLRKAVVKPSCAQCDYKLRPALRLVNNLEVGSIAGEVDPSLAPEGVEITDCAVYVYEGHDVAGDDYGSATEPLTSSAVVQATNQLGEPLAPEMFEYTVGYLAAVREGVEGSGLYTVALTCIEDDPENDDDLLPIESANAIVQPKEETPLGFPQR